jgi:asparagine synthase/glutamine amidotransferase-like protein
MTFLCGLVSHAPEHERRRTLESMVSVLRDGRLSAAVSHHDQLSIAVVDIDPCPAVVSPDGRRTLWTAGEVFNGVPAERVLSSIDAVRDIDGEYQMAVWDSGERTLSIVNDRFGGLPLYVAEQNGAFLFAGGVRGILAVPGFAIVVDEDAIREAVTFGGYRLGGRTNVAGISMIAGGTVTIWNARSRSLGRRRYWSWPDIRPAPRRDIRALFGEASSLWRQAITRRLTNGLRHGQTLSGGLDSRVILAEATRHVPAWVAITYGIEGCDDARYAEMAAARAGAKWLFMPLSQPGWLEMRTDLVQTTDGLIDLHDLGHLESVPVQSSVMDVHLSGYIGDAVGGPTFTDVSDARGVLRKLPYYGGILGMPEADALARAEGLIRDIGSAAPRYALFEHKLPQSTNRWASAFRPWLRVRKPFTDYDLFDFYQGMDVALRGEENFYEKWLLAAYPEFFRSIPNQKTGVPIRSSWIRWQAARGRRFLRRKLRPHVARFGLFRAERSRGYTRDEVEWRTPQARSILEGTILRSDSLSCDIFGRDRVNAVLKAWFDSAAAPAQVIGALYVFEAYHRDVAKFIRSRAA